MVNQMKLIFKSFLTLAILIANFSQIDCLAKPANKTSINLIKPADPKIETKDELLQELLPKEEITEFDITTQESPLDVVRSAETLEDYVQPYGFKNPPSKEDRLLQEKGLQIAPAELDRLLYPRPGKTQEEEESPLASKALLKLDLKGQQENLEPFQMARNQALVQDLGNGEFEVDASFERQIPTLIDMNKLAYAIGKRGTLDGEYDKLIDKLKGNLKIRGWEIEEFAGKTGKGNKKDDIPGFVAYNKEQNVMTVIVRGSQTREDDDGSPDWEVNFDAQLIDFPFGKVHGGFYNRTKAMLPNIQRAMNRFIDDLDNETKSKIKVVVSGHSQGAALASILMPLLAEIYTANGKFGSKFNNALSNVFQGYFISTPRVYSGDSAVNWINSVVGEHNMIRQNVTGGILADPVPVGSPGRTMTALLSLIPFFGEGLAEKYGGDKGTRSVGYLAADWSGDVLTRQLGNDALSLVARRAKGYFWNRWDILVDAAKKPWHLLTLKTQKKLFTQLMLEPVKDGLTTLVAPLHYGSTNSGVEEGEGLFRRDIVAGYNDSSPTMAELLAQGFQKKKSEREGLSGFIRGGIEEAARQKANLPDLAAVASGIKTTVTDAAKTVAGGLKSAFSGFKKKLFGL